MILRNLLLLTVSFLGLIRSALAQDIIIPKPKKVGELYFQWGYNRDWYSKSNIHVYRHDADPNNSYDFMLFDAVAHDKPDMKQYWHVDRLTIPQYDFTGGYFFNDKYDLGVEVGWNHLKYVVTDGQMIHIKGQVHETPIDVVQPLDSNFFHMQHTNGNNYLIVSLVKRQRFFNSKYVQASGIAKIGAGPMISYTIDRILGDYDPGYFHYHGYVLAASLGLRISFLKYLYIQSDIQGGYANYTNTKLGHEHLGTAIHHFYSLQWTWEGGFTFPIGKK